MTNGGWTRIFANTFTIDRLGFIFNAPCPCTNFEVDSDGWFVFACYMV